MPANERSLKLTDLYRDSLTAFAQRATRQAEDAWQRIDLADLDATYVEWLGSTTAAVARSQADAVRHSLAYLTAFLASETGRRARTPNLDTRTFIGFSRDGRPLVDAYDSPRVGVLVALKEGNDNDTALQSGLARATRMADLDVMQAGRRATLQVIDEDDRFEGWQRAVRGTCGACAGAAKGTFTGIRFQIHPGCQCVSEPVVRDAPNRFPRPTGREIFAAKTAAEQNEMLGPEAAELVRTGAVSLPDLVARSPQATGEDFITQRPVAELKPT